MPAPIASADDPFIKARTTVVTLNDGTEVTIRPIVTGDRERLQQGFERLSPESRYRRFFSPVNRLSESMLRYLTEVDYVDHFAWVAETEVAGELRGIGVARYVRTGPTAAEAAVTVADDFQGRGLGSLLFDALVLQALENGIRCFEGDVLADNESMRGVLGATGAVVERASQGICRWTIDLPMSAEHVRQSAPYELLRAVAKREADFERNPMRDISA
jgi:GNAT superfamily N-acetyltransferase